MREWEPQIEWHIGPLQTHALLLALKRQIALGLVDPKTDPAKIWLSTFEAMTSCRAAPVPPDFQFFKDLAERELGWLADFVGDERYPGCDYENCSVHGHRQALRYFLKEKLDVEDKFADTLY